MGMFRAIFAISLSRNQTTKMRVCVRLYGARLLFAVGFISLLAVIYLGHAVILWYR